MKLCSKNLGQSLMLPVRKRAKMKSKGSANVHVSSRSSTMNETFGGTLRPGVRSAFPPINRRAYSQCRLDGTKVDAGYVTFGVGIGCYDRARDIRHRTDGPSGNRPGLGRARLPKSMAQSPVPQPASSTRCRLSGNGATCSSLLKVRRNM